MRTSIFILGLVVCLIITSCTPSNDPVPTSKNKITITSITPDVYWDDEITITGTGFDADAAKDTVDFGEFGIPDPDEPDYVNDTTKVFYPLYLNTIKKTNYIIVNASATQLIIKPLAPDSLYKLLFSNNYDPASVDFNFRVRSKGAFAVSENVRLKNIPRIQASNIEDFPLTPGDSTWLIISGVFSSSICDVNLYLSCSKLAGCTYVDPYLNTNLYYVAGPCSCDDFATQVYGCSNANSSSSIGRLIKYDESNHSASIFFLVPENFFNTTYGSGFGPTINIAVKVVNKDGRSSKVITLPIRTYPTH